MPGATGEGTPYAVSSDPLSLWPTTSQSVATAIDGRLSKAGGTLTGAVSAPDATADAHLATLRQVKEGDAGKASVADMNAALASRVTTAEMNAALAPKVNTVDMNAALALKVNTTDMNTAIASAVAPLAQAATVAAIGDNAYATAPAVTLTWSTGALSAVTAIPISALSRNSLGATVVGGGIKLPTGIYVIRWSLHTDSGIGSVLRTAWLQTSTDNGGTWNTMTSSHSSMTAPAGFAGGGTAWLHGSAVLEVASPTVIRLVGQLGANTAGSGIVRCDGIDAVRVGVL